MPLIRTRRIVTLVLGLPAGTACAGGNAPSPPRASPAPAALRDERPPALVSAPEAGPAPSASPGPPPAPAPPPSWPPVAPEGIHTDWCTESVVALDEETCFVLPDARPTTLLIYLHGLVPPEATSRQKTDFQLVVANASRRAGVAALVPRGTKGLASSPRERWWGWPTGPLHYASHASALVLRLEAAQEKLEAHLGAPFERRYVAGSSAGAYFTALLALRGGIAADGFAATSGGSVPQGPLTANAPKRPFYVGYGNLDSAAPQARALAAFLEREGWPVRVAEHPTGHGAREIYLDEAFAFFGEAGKGPGRPR